MEQKKPTNAQLQKRIANALIHIDRTKNTKSIYWSDKGCRLTADDDYAIIAFGFSQTVYNSFTSAGISRPYLYTKRIIEIANENLKEIEADGGYSYQRLLDVLKEKEDKSEYNIVTYFSWFLQNLFSPQFGIAEDDVSSFLVYEDYIHNIAKNSILLSERNEDLTNKQFIDKMVANIKEFTDNLEETVLLHKKSDDELMKENMEATASFESENAITQEIEK